MLDTHSELRSDARTVAFFHPGTQTTWPDMVRQSRNEDTEVHLYRACSESRLAVSAASLMLRFPRLQLKLSHRLARRVQIGEQYLPLKRHFRVHR